MRAWEIITEDRDRAPEITLRSLKQGFAPSRVVTDKLRSYPSAFRAIGLAAEHDRGLRANNKAENSPQPVRRRERKLQRFKSPGSAQRFLNIHSATYNTFYHQRHLLKRSNYKQLQTTSFDAWQSASIAALTWIRVVQAVRRSG